MRHFSSRFILKALFLGLFLLHPTFSQANALKSSYIPPEIAYAEDLRQQVSLPERLDLNTMNLSELRSLTGLNEDWALKILRNRPFADVQDFYKRMPGVSIQQLQLFIRQWQPRLQF